MNNWKKNYSFINKVISLLLVCMFPINEGERLFLFKGTLQPTSLFHSAFNIPVLDEERLKWEIAQIAASITGDPAIPGQNINARLIEKYASAQRGNREGNGVLPLLQVVSGIPRKEEGQIAVEVSPTFAIQR